MSNCIIGFLREDFVGQAEDLWDYCFEKSTTPFFKWYFQQIRHRENIIGYLADDKLLSMLFLNPYKINFHNKVLPLSYIVGVATVATERGRGLFREVIKNTFAVLEKREEPIVLLMPSMAGFYLPYGFAFCYEQLKYHFPLDVLKTFRLEKKYELKILSSNIIDYQEMNSIYINFHEQHHAYVIREHDNWQSIIDVHLMEGGQIILCYQDNILQGYLLYSILDDTFKVLEMVYLSTAVRDTFFSFAYQHYSQAKFFFWQSATDDLSYLNLVDHKNAPSKVLFMMGRIINVPKALALLSPPNDLQIEIALQITDEYIADNNKIFLLQIADGKIQTTVSNKIPELKINIGQLAQLLFGYSSPQTLSRNNFIDCSDQATLSKLQKLFPSQSNYINEYF